MPTITVPGHGDVDFPDTMSDADVLAAVRKLAPPAAEPPGLARRALTWATTPFESAKPMLEHNRQLMNAAGGGIVHKDSGDLLAGAARFVGAIPGADPYAVSDEQTERLERFDKDHPFLRWALPVAAGFGRPAPGTLPAAARPAPDAVAEQLARVRSLSQAAAAPVESGAVAKTLEFLIPSKVKLAYKLAKRLAGKSETGVSGTPYPKSEPYMPIQRTVAQASQAAPEADPALAAAAERSRAAIFERLKASEPIPAIPEEPFTPIPRRPPPTPQPAPAPDPKLVAAAQARRAAIMETARHADQGAPVAAPAAPTLEVVKAAPATVGDAFKSAMRGAKVSALTKTVEANAIAHLGADTMSPQFAEALTSMPEEWWQGIAKVANVNKPSQETISEVAQFFRDRAAQQATASARRAGGQ